jgi:hypothetical protein
MVSMNIIDEVVSVHRLDVALVVFCNKIFDEYGVFRLSTLPKYNSTGVKTLEEGDELNNNIVQIRESDVGVYTDGDTDEIIQFISDSMQLLEINNEDIKFKFKALKEKDWEKQK